MGKEEYNNKTTDNRSQEQVGLQILDKGYDKDIYIGNATDKAKGKDVDI